MQVTKLTLTLRYSKELTDGAWKSIEVGAEAVPSEEQSWQAQQRELYAELAGQLRTLFTNHTANTTPPAKEEPATNGS